VLFKDAVPSPHPSLPQVLTSPAAAKERVTPKSTREKTRMVDWLVVTVGKAETWMECMKKGGRERGEMK
jgi:hypothetical protein